MRMIDLGSQRGPLQVRMNLNVMDSPTAVDCGREIRYRRSFRSLMECVVPCCGFQPTTEFVSDEPDSPTSTCTVTGTFFGYRKGRVSFCLQEDSRSSPLLLLEFAIPTAFLAKEMQHGLLRIALVECRPKSCWDGTHGQEGVHGPHRSEAKKGSLFKVPVWSMYCNGRKVGYASRRQTTVGDLAVLKVMQSVSVGAGVLPTARTKSDQVKDDADNLIMYLRASFKRVSGSTDSESFHMINPAGSSGQELSIFLLRS